MPLALSTLSVRSAAPSTSFCVIARVGLAGLLAFALFLPPLQATAANVLPSVYEPAGTGGYAALDRALAKLEAHRRLLVIGAHPDDEDTSALALVSRELGGEAAYLSLSRGEGGQNLIGPDLGEALGVLRTQELLAARGVDGARQYFTRAFDFGYTRSLPETFGQWPEEVLLADAVRIVRRFKPQVILSVFGNDGTGGHGQHQAAGHTAFLAFARSAGPLPALDQSGEAAAPWKAQALFRAAWFAPESATVSRPLGAIDPWSGLSTVQLAMKSRGQHRSQDMGRLLELGPRDGKYTFVEGPGGASGNDLFAGIDTSLAGIAATLEPGSLASEVRSHLTNSAVAVRAARSMLRPDDLAAAVTPIVRALAELDAARAACSAARQPGARAVAELIAEKIAVGEQALLIASGVAIDVYVDRAELVPGEPMKLSIALWNAGAKAVKPLHLATWGELGRGLSTAAEEGFREQLAAHTEVAAGELVRFEQTLTVGPDARTTRPYFLELPRREALYDWSAAAESERGEPFGAPVLAGRITLEIDGRTVRLDREAVYRYADQARGEIRRPVAVVPRLELSVSPEVAVWPHGGPAPEIAVDLASHVAAPLSGELAFTGNCGARPPAAIPFLIEEARGSASLRVPVPDCPANGTARLALTVTATSGDERSRAAAPLLDYPHVPPSPLRGSDRFELVRADIRLPQLARVGYVLGASDKVPELLAEIGVPVQILSAADLENGDLARFDAIVVGSRAYETDRALQKANGRLLDYVRAGGLAIVQYQQYPFTDGKFAPYLLEMSRPHGRITDETAPVKLLVADHPAFTTPNRIGAADWEGWVQERSLYMPSAWEAAYTPLLELQDPDQPAQRGGLLVAGLGQGTYVYTGLAFFRQLPAGVPGAYRLFANLLALGRSGAERQAAFAARGRELADRLLVVDTHIDVPYRLKDEMEDVSLRTAKGDFDYPRAVAGGLDTTFMSIYVPAKLQETGGAKALADGLIDMVEGIVASAPAKWAMAATPDQALANRAAGRLSFALGIENGAAIEDQLANLAHFHSRGVRYVTLTHGKNNLICDSSYETPESRLWHGLSPFGREVVAEMNRLGIMVDLSHVSDEAFDQALALSQAPPFASHSSCRHFTPGFERNLDDRAHPRSRGERRRAADQLRLVVPDRRGKQERARRLPRPGRLRQGEGGRRELARGQGVRGRVEEGEPAAARHPRRRRGAHRPRGRDRRHRSRRPGLRLRRRRRQSALRPARRLDVPQPLRPPPRTRLQRSRHREDRRRQPPARLARSRAGGEGALALGRVGSAGRLRYGTHVTVSPAAMPRRPAQRRNQLLAPAFLVLAAAVSAVSAQGTAAEVYLVRDIRPSNSADLSADSIWSILPHLQDWVPVWAGSANADAALWTTDGTSAGTMLVSDLVAQTYAPHAGRVLCRSGRTMYFWQDAEEQGGIELWKSDGTAEGTTVVAAWPRYWFAPFENPQKNCDARTVEGRILFWVQRYVDWTSYGELWSTDGTSAGTVFIKALGQSPNYSDFVRGFAVFRGRLYFGMAESVHGPGMWTSDGTAAGTSIFVGAVQPDSFRSFGERLYFSYGAGGGVSPRLGATDGSPGGTHFFPEYDFAIGADPLSAVVESGGRLLFAASRADVGFELWGMEVGGAGPLPLTDLPAGASLQSFLWGQGSAVSGRALFWVSGPNPESGTTSRVGLLASDGSVGGTSEILTFTLDGSGDQVLHSLGLMSNAGLFQFKDGSRCGLWRTDGTTGGTSEFLTWTGYCPDSLYGAVSTATHVYFSWGTVWASDGTAAGTSELVPLSELSHEVRFDEGTAKLPGGDLLFAVDTRSAGAELWRSDGSVAGTHQVLDLTPASLWSHPNQLSGGEARVAFFATEDDHGKEPWVSDGTDAGTYLLADFADGPASSGMRTLGYLQNSWPMMLADTASPSPRLYLASGQLGDLQLIESGDDIGTGWSDGQERYNGRAVLTTGWEIWSIAESPPEATLLAQDLELGFDFVTEFSLGIRGLYYPRVDNHAPVGVWITDGTPERTRLFCDSGEALYFTSGSRIVEFGAGVAFTSRGYSHSLELWVCDHEGAIARSLDLTRLGIAQAPAHPAAVGSHLVFAATDPQGDRELWRSDGTTEGSAPLVDIFAGGSSQPENFFAFDGRVLFTAIDAIHGRELWITDGTAAGTLLVADLAPGLMSSLPADFQLSHGAVVFTAGTPASGRELWVTAGTSESTRLLFDANPGPASSSPAEITPTAGRIFFRATDSHGAELWAACPGWGAVAELTTAAVSEGVGTLAVGVQLTMPAACGGGRFLLEARSGSATAGVDFTAEPQTVAFIAGAQDVVMAVTLLDDALPEDGETLLPRAARRAGPGRCRGRGTDRR